MAIEDLKSRLCDAMDPYEVVARLEITTEELVEALHDIINQNRDKFPELED